MTTRLGFLTLAALALGACGGDAGTPEEPTMTPLQVLPNIAIPPGGSPVGSQGGTDAASLLVSTPMVSDSVAAFYRDLLAQPPYRLINESTNNGIVSFYVEQDGPPLWVTVEALPAGGTLVRLSGAAIKADSAAAARPAT